MEGPFVMIFIFLGMLSGAWLIIMFPWRWNYDRQNAHIAKLTDALQCLYDEQQGPPLELPRHKASWQAAMDKASKLLEAK